MNTRFPDGARVVLTGQYHHYLHIDGSRFHFVPDLKRRPNLKISLIRGIALTADPDGPDYLHPKKKPLWAVTVDGANLLEIFAYPENADLPDGSALEPEAPAPPTGARPGFGARVFGDADFRGPEGPPRVFEEAVVRCPQNEWRNRPASVRLTGTLLVPKDGTYQFEVASDDDALLYLNGQVVVANDSTRTTRRRAKLKAGAYAIRIDFRNDVGDACLRVSWGPGEDPGLPLAVLGARDVVH